MEWTTTIDAPGKAYLMQGNEAVARGAVEAGIRFAASYPGSPSSQILMMLGNIAEKQGFYAEWSTNEVCALESCLGASFAGARALCIVKQNGLLVLSDALHCGALSGIRGGLVLVSSDDPSAHSSNNEFDSRHIGVSANVPVLEPSSIQEAKDIIPYAFALSEQLRQIVVVRVTTRVCHGRSDVTLGELPTEKKPFLPVGRWDRMVCINWLHANLLDTLEQARERLETCPFSHYDGPADAKDLIITAGTGYLYCRETIAKRALADRVGLLSLGGVWPLPEQTLLNHLQKAVRVLVVEEVDPFLEEHIAALIGRRKLPVTVIGRGVNGLLPRIGELNPAAIDGAIVGFLGLSPAASPADTAPALPDRELTFCAGCPHRATFFVLKQALALDRVPGVVVGDIGCYTLAGQRAGQYGYQFMNCMGSGINAAAGLGQLGTYGFDQQVITMAGDSTFFHSSIPGLINAQYHKSNVLFLVLDNSATAMTGFQPHPGTGLTAMGRPADPISIEKIVEAIGCSVIVADPFEVEKTTALVHELLHQPGVKVLIMRQMCATLAVKKNKTRRRVYVDPDLCRADDCGCGRFCSRVWGCPGNSWDFSSGKARIDEVQCVGCGVCKTLCPAGAIKMEGGDEA